MTVPTAVGRYYTNALLPSRAVSQITKRRSVTSAAITSTTRISQPHPGDTLSRSNEGTPFDLLPVLTSDPEHAAYEV